MRMARFWASVPILGIALGTMAAVAFFGSGVGRGMKVSASGTQKPAGTAAGKPGSVGPMHFSYNYQSGPFVRKVSGTVTDVQGLWNALLPLQPPKGAHGGYGLIGDDNLLGQKPGYGLRQLGKVARKYVTFDNLYVEQPSGWEAIDVQAGVFTNVDKLNDVTLGWVFFDVRGNFETDMKKLLNPAP